MASVECPACGERVDCPTSTDRTTNPITVTINGLPLKSHVDRHVEAGLLRARLRSSF